MRTWVHHRGALGDSILVWPHLRARLAEGDDVTFVTDASKARLASRVLGVRPMDAESSRLLALWRDGPCERFLDVDRLDLAMGASPAMLDRASRLFPNATIGTDLLEGPLPPLRDGGEGVVLHVGAGSNEKRWSLDRFLALGDGLGATLLAGEVEVERLTDTERDGFEKAGGRFLDSLDALVDVLEGAGVFVGNDSGPSHLAAQLGLPTLAIFGPTDPARWSPIGPRVRVLHDDLEGIEVERVAGILRDEFGVGG